MVMLNDLDRYHLVIDVIDRVPGLGPRAGHVRQLMVDKRIEARAYTRLEGEDMPEVARWAWPARRPGPERTGRTVRRGIDRPDPRRQRRVIQPEAAGARPRRRRGRAADLPRPVASPTRRELEDAICGLGAVDAVGHRIVHGGTSFVLPCVVDDEVVCAGIAALTDLAPLHQPKAVAGLAAVTARASGCAAGRLLRHRLPRDPPPRGLHVRAAPPSGAAARSLRRYGFHGLSHAYASRRAAEMWGAPAIRVCGSSPATLALARRWPPGRRAVRGHDDGLHAARRPGDGHAVRDR